MVAKIQVDDALSLTFFDDPARSDEASVDGYGRERLADALRASFEADPVEDGMDHPAEEIIAEALRSSEEGQTLDWLRVFSSDISHPIFASSVLRCLGRHDKVGTGSWRASLVRDGLTADSVEIRDAAVQAAESWDDSDLLDILRSHFEPVSWLRQYIYDVIEDMSG